MVEVAPQGVDFAIVRQIAERMGQFPGRKGVGAVPLVNKCQRRDKRLVRQILVERLNLRRQHQPLIDHSSRAEAWEIDIQQLLLQPSAQDKHLALKRIVALPLARGNENLADDRTALARLLAQLRSINRHLAPCQHLTAFFTHDSLQRILLADSVEHHPQGIVPWGRQATA